MTLDPQQLRKDTLQRRDALSSTEIEQASDSLCQRLLELPEVSKSSTIFAYVSFRSEIATFGLIEKFLEAGKTVTVPITYVKERRLDAIKITDIDNDLIPGYCNIPEPTPELCRTSIVDPGEIDTILLPGSVFDHRGGRFGYGGGFYDRFVSAIPQATRIGLAYDLQVVETIPLQPHDELLDYIVTPTAVYKGARLQ